MRDANCVQGVQLCEDADMSFQGLTAPALERRQKGKERHEDQYHDSITATRILQNQNAGSLCFGGLLGPYTAYTHTVSPQRIPSLHFPSPGSVDTESLTSCPPSLPQYCCFGPASTPLRVPSSTAKEFWSPELGFCFFGSSPGMWAKELYGLH